MIPGDYLVDDANIQFEGQSNLPLYPAQQDKKLWYCSVTFNSDPIGNRLKYKYSLHFGGKDVVVPFFNYKIDRMSTLPSEHKEKSCKRLVQRQVQFDVFADYRYREGETIPTSVTWYLKWFLQFVKESTIFEILTHTEGFTFKSLNPGHVQELVYWILEQASDCSITDIQRLYLCIVLSLHRKKPDALSYLKDNKTVCDRLLQCFSTCAHLNGLSETALRRLQKIAIILVENSNSPGWLTLAAHIYPYLGIKFLLDNKAKHAKRLDYRYDSTKYKKMVTTLFSCLKVENQGDQLTHQKLLLLVLESAPTLVAALELFKRSEVSRLFATEDERIRFFAKFFDEAQAHQMLELLCLTLSEYTKSDDELKGEDKQVLVKLITSIKDLGTDQLTEILNKLSISKSLRRQDLVLKILNNELFKKDWREIPPGQKLDILTSWVITRVTNTRRVSSLDSAGTVVAVYESIDAIVQCFCTVSLDKYFAEELSNRVVEEISEAKDAINVLQAVASVDKLSLDVQECYISHVKKVLKPEPIKKSSQLLKECSSSRYVVFLNFLRRLATVLLKITSCDKYIGSVNMEFKPIQNSKSSIKSSTQIIRA